MEELKSSKKVWSALRDPWILLGALGVVVLFVITVVTTKWMIRKQNEQAGLGPAPGFTLRDQQGRVTSLSQFRGKVVLLTFIDPECHQLCPLTTQSMLEAVKRLGPRAASQVQLLGVDANPLKTSIEDVADYTRTHGLQGHWRFLTGPVSQLKRIWRSYGIYVAVVHNDIEHTAVIYLIDQRGIERNLYTTAMSYRAVGGQAEALAQGIADLFPERSNVAASNSSPPSPAPSQPKGTLDFTTLGTNRRQITLGSAHAHLVVFFASWLGGDSNLSGDLNVLDSYAALARSNAWPSPVAVDEWTTEPSPAEAQKILDPLAAKLDVPIVEDKTGRLADDYGVDDLPWFVLGSSSGKILWHHDGWISAAALQAQVGAILGRRRGSVSQRLRPAQTISAGARRSAALD